MTDAAWAQKEYLRNAARITQSYMGEPGVCCKELGSVAEASANHAMLEQRLKNAYPAYRLPYMVRYSIYGLAGATARHACATLPRSHRSLGKTFPNTRQRHLINAFPSITSFKERFYVQSHYCGHH